MRPNQKSILIVDDEKGVGDFLTIVLKKQGYEAFYASSGKEALKLCKERSFDLALVDIKMPVMDGIEFLKEAKRLNPSLIFIMITAYPSIETAVEAMKEEAFDYITKPFNVNELKRIIKRALEQQKPSEQVIKIEGIVTQSPAMYKILNMLPKIASAEANVLIMGESGTGKELIARAIHNLSPKRDRPFIAVNCAGIPETLLESELFGYKKGAFTGALCDKMGLFKAADGGTIFLDEIGELSPTLQVKILRVVEEKSFKPIGDTKDIKVDVRIISATNKDLEKEVIEGNFREDLYYRLNVIPIRVPPLRERKEDIPVLVEYFLKKYSKKFKKEIRKVSSSALELLTSYDFPGNVRELENIIERCVALETSNIILPESLMLSNFKKGRPKKDYIPPGGLDLQKKIEEVEKDFLIKALEEARGVKKKAAELLNLSFRSFRYKLKKYKIDK
ncbi:MAG: sigma-54 dependent transcriptional regulator [Deltaproteobacteria bacterium]|nr:sigma-54 dependent transcriptional regulator [Deltaproteobacteria bacterium]